MAGRPILGEGFIVGVEKVQALGFGGSPVVVTILWRCAAIGDASVVEVADIAGSPRRNGHRSMGPEAMTW